MFDLLNRKLELRVAKLEAAPKPSANRASQADVDLLRAQVERFVGSGLDSRIEFLEAELSSLRRQNAASGIQPIQGMLASIDLLRERVASLEKSLTTLAAATSDARLRGDSELIAHSLSLVDESHVVRCRLGVDGAGMMVKLMDASGRTRTELSVSDEGVARISLRDRDAQDRLSLQTSADGAPALVLRDASAEDRLALRAGGSRAAEVILSAGNSSPRVELFLDATDAASLSLRDDLSTVRLACNVDYSGRPEVVLRSADERELAALRQPPKHVPTGFNAISDAMERGALASPSIYGDLEEQDSQEYGERTLTKGERLLEELYTRDLTKQWNAIRDEKRYKMRDCPRSFTADEDVALGIHGLAKRFEWQVLGMEQVGSLIALVAKNRSQRSFCRLSLGTQALLIDDEEREYRAIGPFYKFSAVGSLVAHEPDIERGRQQEGMLVFPQLKAGSRSFTRFVLSGRFLIDNTLVQRRYEIPLR